MSKSKQTNQEMFIEWEEPPSPNAPVRRFHGLNTGRDDNTNVTTQIELSPIAREMLKKGREGKSACLVVLQGTDVGSVIPVHDEVVVIGRSDECTAVLGGDGISRMHARVLVHRDGRVTIQDLGSTNGTFVEGERISEAELHPGDKVLLGRETVLKFVYQDHVDELYHREIYNSAIRDGLTGIYNRKHLDERLAKDASLAARQKIPFTFILLDLDHFKRVNDSFGHQTGDHVLITTSAAVSDLMRSEDVFGRYGGEEFAIIAVGVDGEGARALGERVRERIAEGKVVALDGSGKILKVTASLGTVTVLPTNSADVEKIVAEADSNLYKAKQNGRNQVVSSEIGFA